MKYLFLLLTLLLNSCAQVTSLNLRKHQFGQLPTKIIWLQVAGLNEEHIALLKYNKQSASDKTAFEDFLCIGKAWEYNLFDIRPDANASFLSQITGKKNIKNKCSDYTLKPIWNYMIPNGYKSGVFEGKMKMEQSLIKANQCKDEGKKFISETTFWKMSKNTKKDSKLYHINEIKDYRPGEVYYDKSCLSGECYSTFSQNAIKVFEQFTRKNPNYLYMVRDFSFMKNLANKNVKALRTDLIELEKTIEYFQQFAAKRNDVLLLLTTAETRNVEFPRSGRQWAKFEQTGDYLINRKSQLISTVFASGARAENFCGIYDQSNILSRIHSGAKKQGLELAIINPFEQ